MNIHKVAFVLLVIGGLNWGLMVLGYDLANFLPPMVMTVIYVLVALSAIYEVVSHKGMCRSCNTQGAM